MSKLNDKVAVVTGGSSGIGLAGARRFIANGGMTQVQTIVNANVDDNR